MAKLPAEKIKEFRRELLEFLYHIHPYDISRSSVYEAYYQYYQVQFIDQTLEYLTKKGLIERITKEVPGNIFEEQIKYIIMPNGIDIVEGTSHDNGIAKR